MGHNAAIDLLLSEAGEIRERLGTHEVHRDKLTQQLRDVDDAIEADETSIAAIIAAVNLLEREPVAAEVAS